MSAVWLTLCFFLQVSPELRQHVEAGLKAKAAGDLNAAVREFERVVELAPTLPAAHVNLGAVFLAQKNYAKAIPSLRKGLELNDDLPAAHGMLGTALLAQGFAAEAVPSLQKGGMEDLLAVALLETGRAREAISLLENALGKRPEDPDLLYYLGQAHGRLSKQVFDRLQSSHPGSARARQIAGESLLAAGSGEDAEEYLRAALAVRPDLAGVHLLLGQMYAERGDYEKAALDFGAEAKQFPGSAEAAYHYGLALLHLGQVEAAISELKRSETLQPGMPETLLALGKALAASGDARAAALAFEKVLQAEPASRLAEAAHFQLSAQYQKLGRPADAAREREKVEALRRRRETPPRN